MQPCSLRSISGEVLMRFALLCAAVLIAAPAMAEELVARNGTDLIRLSDGPCTREQVLNRLKPQFHIALRNATALVHGRTFKACWIIDGHAAHLIYEDGDQGLIPLSNFKIPKFA